MKLEEFRLWKVAQNRIRAAASNERVGVFNLILGVSENFFFFEGRVSVKIGFVGVTRRRDDTELKESANS